MIVLRDILIWFVLHMVFVYVCHHLLRDKWYEKQDRLFLLSRFEKQGKIYQDILRIKRWKDIIPDGGKINRRGFEKSKLKRDLPYLRKFYLETKRAELIHWCGMFTCIVFLFIHPFPRNLIVFGVAILLDIPFLLVQRYNRPRLSRLVHKMEKQEGSKKEETSQTY